MTHQQSKYPSTFYRVSLKAIIHNEQGHVLVTKEDRAWSFPGGGMEHGESDIDALRRELYEEAQIDVPFTAVPIGIEPIFVDDLDVWILWVVYVITIPEGFHHAVGNINEIQEIRFRNPEDFKDSDNFWEQYLYKWATKSLRK